ncbi:MAG: HU family DNA-binding protein [Desulfobulbaceae bacterium]|nr:HU family DNA-binding protein [Desulfobulbaceae bacterium]
MNKQELVYAVAGKTGLSKADSKRAVEAALEAIENALKSGRKVTLVGFGTFQVHVRAARVARNPKTGTMIKVAAAKTPMLKAGKRLKDAVTGGTDDPGPSIRRSKVRS